VTTGATGPSSVAAYTRNQTGWVGWVVFGAMMLILLGGFHVVQGLVALLRDEVFLVGARGLLVSVDYTTWGWTHLAGGTLAVLTGVCVLAGQMWARLVAVALAFLSALVNLVFLPAYPFWSGLMITLDVIVMWAVLVHGGELRRPDDDEGLDSARPGSG
jgi:hypothetical protein